MCGSFGWKNKAAGVWLLNLYFRNCTVVLSPYLPCYMKSFLFCTCCSKLSMVTSDVAFITNDDIQTVIVHVIALMVSVRTYSSSDFKSKICNTYLTLASADDSFAIKKPMAMTSLLI